MLLSASAPGHRLCRYVGVPTVSKHIVRWHNRQRRLIESCYNVRRCQILPKGKRTVIHPHTGPLSFVSLKEGGLSIQ